MIQKVESLNMKPSNPVKVWREPISIPTYGIGEPDRNPMFLDKRVYQGSSGAVYPWPVVDHIDDEKQDQTWQAVFLENDFLKIMILPELGGRVQMALDKTNDYHFVYYNQVIKPALVGLAGPWISGGIEFNWPQHHRPNTYGPVDVEIETGDDGSATVWCHEIDRMHRTESRHGLILRPGRSALEIQAHLYNRSCQPQTFLWWANPAIHVDDNHQSIFPQDVNAVLDHGKRDVSTFPIATGEYYKVDYSPGTDISRYRNIPVPTSYMAHRSDYDFVGSYDHGRQAGMLHICDHHVSPGKKQWTWGNGEFGQAWDRHLTDEDGPYIELMCGVFTDNQPDFSWLMPGEEKSFTQYFMPYKGVGRIGNASIDAVVGLDWADEKSVANSDKKGSPRQVAVRGYTTREVPAAKLQLHHHDQLIFEHTWDADPSSSVDHQVTTPANCQLSELKVSLLDQSNKCLVAWSPRPFECGEALDDCDSFEHTGHPVPDAATAIELPADVESTEALFLAGKHIEQYRHATRRSIDYFNEALRRDPGDIRCNQARGDWLYRRGQFAESIKCYKKAIQRLTRHNPNPYDGFAHLGLGLALARLDRLDEAYDVLKKSCWNQPCRDRANFELARIATRRGNLQEAIELCKRCLRHNAKHAQARHLEYYLRSRLNENGSSDSQVAQNDVNPFCFGILFEQAIANGDFSKFDQLSRNDENTAIEIAIDYAACGAYDRVVEVLQHTIDQRPQTCSMVHYHLADALIRLGQPDRAVEQRRLAAQSTDLYFANKLADIGVLERAMKPDESGAAIDARAAYLLGNLWYDRQQHDQAVACWQLAQQADPKLATVARNLSLAMYNQHRDEPAAWEQMSLAFSLDSTDARVLFELDQLAARLGHSPTSRLQRLLEFPDLVDRRDDLLLARVSLQNLVGQHQAALSTLQQRQFHPWEGGEGKVPQQYMLAGLELAREELEGATSEANPDRAIELLNQAMVWPENLGEGKLVGTQENHLHYWLGCAYAAKGDQDQADHWLRSAAAGTSEPTSAMYYNDQPPEMIFYQGLALARLGQTDEALQRFNRLIDYGIAHLNDQVHIDYFAVSLPDFLVFEADLNKNNAIHCWFMIALGCMGLQTIGQTTAERQVENQSVDATQAFEKILTMDPSHVGAVLHQRLHHSKSLSSGSVT
jgi:tetratricopeptide (TPR) repeat protein